VSKRETSSGNKEIRREMAFRRTTYQRRQVMKTGRVFQLGPTATKYLLLVLVAVFSMFFLAQSSQSANKTVEIRALESKKADSDKQYGALEVEASRQQSLQNLSTHATTLQMVPTDKNPAVVEVTPSADSVKQ